MDTDPHRLIVPVHYYITSWVATPLHLYMQVAYLVDERGRQISVTIPFRSALHVSVPQLATTFAPRLWACSS